MIGMTGQALKGHLDLLLISVLSNGPANEYAIVEAGLPRGLNADESERKALERFGSVKV